MKLTTKNLKQLINEVMNEVRLEPDYSNFASDDQITKIRSLLDSGDPGSINMAKTLLDALGASPSYFDDYMRNQEVGEVEKLANKHIDLGHDHVLDPPSHERLARSSSKDRERVLLKKLEVSP